MSEQEQNIYSLVFIILFVVASALLIALVIRKIKRDKTRSIIIREQRIGVPTQKLCAMVMMVPSFFELLMNTYYQVFLQYENAKYWFSIIDLLFFVSAIIVYNGLAVQWVIFLMQIVQVYTFAPSILNHIDDGVTLPLIRLFCAFVYYVISACVMIRVMYPFMFDRRVKVSG